jgi:hypothetical protein
VCRRESLELTGPRFSYIAVVNSQSFFARKDKTSIFKEKKIEGEKKACAGHKQQSAARLSFSSSREKLAWLSLRQQLYVLILT